MSETNHRFPYRWNLKDAIFTKDRGKVFSCFACGGGSTMGYKLAGFDVIGCNEIDHRMNKVYVANHHPKFNFLEPIQTFKLRNDLPDELYHLDILDGSPPCSSFSTAGNRGKDWGKEKVFKEGQAMQVLDTLFFDFIDLAKKLQPKIVVAENVRGLMLGEAIQYVRKIYSEFEKAGYIVQHWLLDAAEMGVPQRRQRVFFIALRNDLCNQFLYQKDLFTQAPRFELSFNEKEITYGEFRTLEGSTKGITPYIIERMNQRTKEDHSIGDINLRVYGKVSMFNNMIVYDHEVMPTVVSGATFYRDCDVKTVSKEDFIHAGSFPMDYDFMDQLHQYIIGMSVPPVMVAQIANQIYKQWLSKIN